MSDTGTEKRRGTMEILWFFFRAHKLKMGVLVIALLFGSALEAASVAVVYPLLDVAFDGGGGQGVVLSLFRGLAAWMPVADEFIAYCLLFLVLAVTTFVVKVFSIRYRLTFAGRLVDRNQKEIFNKFLRADYQYFVEHKQGEIIYNVITAPQSLQTFLYSSTELLAQAALSISVFLLLLSLSWQGTLAILLMGLLYSFFTRYLAERVAYDSGKRQAEAVTGSAIILNETIDGIKQLKVFNTMGEWAGKFGETVTTQWTHYIRRFTWQQALHPTLMLLLYLFLGIIAIAIRIAAPDSFALLIPVFGTFAFAVFRLIPIIGGVSNAVMQIMGSLPNCERIYRVLTEKLVNIPDGVREMDSFNTGIELDMVAFAYKGRNQVLEDVSITFEKGKTTAIVGRSGSGKTTVISLLLRLYDVTGGEIRIDGVNIKEYRMASWLEKIGYVSQDTFIFNDSIRNNITFGTEYAEEEIVRVSRDADVHNFVAEQPEGYDTMVGDRGLKLSGGQKQRIAVSRAMIRDPEILIFDEATSALDNISEAAVQKAINEVSKNHTVIVIAHRLSTIVNADKIVVLGEGKVLEEGTHKELMGKGGAYSELYRSQPV